MNSLSKDELEAVLAHELTHVINHDVRTMVVASIFAGIITVLAELFFRILLRSGGGRSRSSSKSSGKGGGGAIVVLVIAVAIAAIGYILAIVIRMSLSRSREFVADAGSVELTKNPDAMISALRKVAGSSELEGPEQLRGMYLNNHETGFNRLFASHPPIEKRIDALVQFAGGRDEPAVPLVS
jgi:heat shock protein HtpX